MSSINLGLSSFTIGAGLTLSGMTLSVAAAQTTITSITAPSGQPLTLSNNSGSATVVITNAGAVQFTGSLSFASLSLSGSGGLGFLEVLNQGSAPATPTSAGRIFFDSANRFSWVDTDGIVASIDGTALAVNRIFTLQDVSGVLLQNVNGAGMTTTNLNSVTATVLSNLTLTGGSSGASLALGQGTDGAATLTAVGAGNVILASTTGNVTTARPVTITNATASTTVGTGALIVTGGAGFTGTVSTSGRIIAVATDADAHTMAVTEHVVVYTGTGGHTFTWLAASSNTNRCWHVKHAGSGNLVLDATGLGQFFNTALVNTITLSPGDAILCVSTGTFWAIL